jgi:O-antigen/teichoic acid export membrane protein
MEQGRRVFLNSLINVSRRPVAMAVALLLTPFILHSIGAQAYGVWALTGSLMAYAMLFKLGLNAAVDLHVPKLVPKNDVAGINRVVSSIFFFYTATALVLVGLLALLIWKFPDWFSVGPELRETSRWVVGLVGGGLAVGMPMTVFFGVLAGVQRYELIVAPVIGFELLRAGLIVLLLKQGMGLLALTVVTAGADLAVTLCVTIAAHRMVRGLSVRPRFIDMPMLPGLIAYSGSNLMYSSGQLIMMQSGKALTGVLFDPETVTEFTIPFTALIMIGTVVMQAVIVLKPAVSLMQSQHESEGIRRAYLLSTKYAFMLGAPAAIVFLVNGRELLEAWVGSEFVGRGPLILAILAVPHAFRQAHMGGFTVLSGLGKHRVFGGVVLAQGVVSIVLGWLLAGPFELGLLGVAIGYAVPELIASALIVPLHCCHTVGVSPWREVRECLLPALWSSVPVLLYCLGVRNLFPDPGRWPFVGLMLGCAVPFLAGAWFLGLGREERRRMLGYLRRDQSTS